MCYCQYKLRMARAKFEPPFSMTRRNDLWLHPQHETGRSPVKVILVQEHEHHHEHSVITSWSCFDHLEYRL